MKIQKLLLLVALVGVCLLLLTLQTRGYGAAARDALTMVTAPVQTGLARASRATASTTSGGRMRPVGLFGVFT